VKKKSSAGNAAIWWALVVLSLAGIGWILVRTSREAAESAASGLATNRVDFSRATNLLDWLKTNIALKPEPAPTPTVSTNAVVLRPTNRITLKPTNLFAPAPSIVAASSAVSMVKPPSNNVSTALRPIRDIMEAQIALERLAISSGPVDGVHGAQTRAALRAFQWQNDLDQTGDLDDATRAALKIADPVYTNHVVTSGDLARLRATPELWLEKSRMDVLDYETILELVAETHHASQTLVRKLNPLVNWTNVLPQTVVKVPLAVRAPAKRKAGFLRIELAGKILQAFDAKTNLIAHFPCSIAARVEKRPWGLLSVVTAAHNPNYTFDPGVFPESEEAQEIGRKLIIPPGPNNPVGVAWISLDKPGYGIHGTPKPEQVGRTESHGCFRLANWNAEYLLKICWAGLPVYVVP